MLPTLTKGPALGPGSLAANGESVVRAKDENCDGTVEDCMVFAAEFSDLLDGQAAGFVPLPGNAVLFASTRSLWHLEDENGDGPNERPMPLLTGLEFDRGMGFQWSTTLRPGQMAICILLLETVAAG